MLASLRGAVLNSGAVDHQAYQQSNRIGYDVALAALDPFARIIPPSTTAFSGFYALAIYDPCRWLGFAVLGQARNFDQLLIYLIKQAVIAPRVEIAPNR